MTLIESTPWIATMPSDNRCNYFKLMLHDYINLSDPISQISLRPFRDYLGVVDRVRTWLSDPCTTRFLTITHTAEELCAIFTNDRTRATWAVYHARNGLIGWAGLRGLDSEELSAHRSIVIGDPDHRGKGYGGVIGTLLIEAAEQRGLKRLETKTLNDNVPSLRNLRRQMNQVAQDEQYTYFELPLPRAK